MPNIKISCPDLKKISQQMRGLAEQAPQMMQEVVWDLTDYAAQLADAECPVGEPAIEGVKKGGSSGTLRQSLFIEKTENTGRFGYSAKYAAYVEYGTPAHEIAPGAKGFLAWPIGATDLGPKRSGKTGKYRQKHIAIRWVFTTQPVQHPGTQPVGWVRKAVEDAQAHLEQIASAVFERYAGKIQIGGAKSA